MAAQKLKFTIAMDDPSGLPLLRCGLCKFHILLIVFFQHVPEEVKAEIASLKDVVAEKTEDIEKYSERISRLEQQLKVCMSMSLVL